MDYGERLERAMEKGGFDTDQKLADEMTQLLRSQGRIGINEVFNYQTVQSARTRIAKDSHSKFTLDFARLCKVDPYWLAFGVGTMELISPNLDDDPGLARLVRLWASLSAAECENLVQHAEWLKAKQNIDTSTKKRTRTKAAANRLSAVPGRERIDRAAAKPRKTS